MVSFHLTIISFKELWKFFPEPYYVIYAVIWNFIKWKVMFLYVGGRIILCFNLLLLTCMWWKCRVAVWARLQVLVTDKKSF